MGEEWSPGARLQARHLGRGAEGRQGSRRHRAGRERNAHVNQDHIEGGYPLGKWVGVQRAGRSALSAERHARLEGLPGWTWHAHSERWSGGLKLLQQFIAREGHARVPAQQVEGGFYLGAWVREQRRAAADGDLHTSRRARLVNVPGWVWDTSASAAWEEGFSYLQRYVDRFETARVVAYHVEADGYHLGRWCSKQRARYSRGELDTDQVARLNALPGWWWSSTHRARWDDWFALLAKFAAREGHTVVPLGDTEDGAALGKWVSHQRGRYASDDLTPQQIVRLEELPGWTWDAGEAQWEEQFRRLAGFADREGHTDVPARHVENGRSIGKWARRQKTNHTSGNLSTERVARLEALPGWTWHARTKT